MIFCKFANVMYGVHPHVMLKDGDTTITTKIVHVQPIVHIVMHHFALGTYLNVPQKNKDIFSTRMMVSKNACQSACTRL